jgi:hypothetical protein
MRKLLILALAFVAITGCKKNDDTPTEVSLEVTANNVAGTYKITAATASVAGITQDIFNNNSFFDACDKDDTYTLTAATSTSGAYNVTDAGVQCAPSNTATGTYSLNTAAKTITINGQTGNITTLTATKLVVSQPNFMGSSFTVTVTYTRQ